MSSQARGPTTLVPSLGRLCLGVLIRYRDLLGDIGWVDVSHVRHITSHCNAAQLAHIEDATRQGSGRDISWYTWDCWFRFYEQKFGAARASNAVIAPLPGTQPPDYTPPAGIGAPTADWRGMMARDTAHEQARAAQVSNRLRNLYDTATKDKATRSVEVCAIKPPPTRRRLVGPSSSSGSRGNGSSARPTPPADKAKAKMLHDLGMSSVVSAKKDTKQVGRTHKVTVTRTVVVRKATHSSPASSAARPGMTPLPAAASAGGANRLSGSSAGGKPGNRLHGATPSPSRLGVTPPKPVPGGVHSRASRSPLAVAGTATAAGSAGRASHSQLAGQLSGQKRQLESNGDGGGTGSRPAQGAACAGRPAGPGPASKQRMLPPHPAVAGHGSRG